VGIYGTTAPKKHYKQSETAVETWLETEYPEIEKKAREVKAQIYWIDETGIANTSNYVRGYAPRGKTPTMPIASEHIRVNMISAITNQGKVRFHFYRDKLNQDFYITFLKRLMRNAKGKIFAIADNLKVHHGLVLQDWAKRYAYKLSLYFLPSYSPELNPDEYLNNTLKHEMAKRGYSRNADEVEKKARSIMRSIQSTKGKAASFFHHEKVRYASLPCV
jgi:transposase